LPRKRVKENVLRENLARKLRLTLVVSQAEAKPRTVFELAEEAFRGGVTALQLREKNLPGREHCELARDLAAFCRERERLFIVNDRLDIALASGADGVHLGQSDIPAVAAAAILGKNRVLGVSAATVGQGEEALAAGADYLGVGTIFRTDSKREAEVVDPGQIALINALGLVTVAIGGISEKNSSQVWDMGFDGLAVISALARSADPASTAMALAKGWPVGREG
jgi:thiamine-phosphate pyrophosphorylase